MKCNYSLLYMHGLLDIQSKFSLHFIFRMGNFNGPDNDNNLFVRYMHIQYTHRHDWIAPKSSVNIF